MGGPQAPSLALPGDVRFANSARFTCGAREGTLAGCCWQRRCCSGHSPAATRGSGSHSGVCSGRGQPQLCARCTDANCEARSHWARQPGAGDVSDKQRLPPPPASLPPLPPPLPLFPLPPLPPHAKPLAGCCRLLLPAARPTHPDEGCHEVGFTYWAGKPLYGNEDEARRQGRELCQGQELDLNWFWVRTEMEVRSSASGAMWKAICRRCGLPRNSVLMW